VKDKKIEKQKRKNKGKRKIIENKRSPTMTARTAVLATPKKDFLQFPDRRSVYWVDEEKRTNGEASLTPRQVFLSNHRPLCSTYLSHRPAPVWTVSPAAQKGAASPRVATLALHRPLVNAYNSAKDVITAPTDAAMKAQATARVELLSVARGRLESDDFVLPPYPYPITKVTDKAKKATCNSRLAQLSQSKELHTSWTPPKENIWAPSLAAKKARSSGRVQELAAPKPRLEKDLDYDPYLIPAGAMLARASNRVNELCLPIDRKQSRKFAPKKQT